MESRRKTILLLVLGLVALGVGLYTFRGKPKPSSPAAVTAAAPRQAPSEASHRPPAKAGEEPAGAGAEAATRNPFSAPAGPGSAATTARQPAAAAQPAPGPTPGVEPPPGAEQPAAAPGQAESPGKPMALTGIVAGQARLAVIREEGQRYFVKVGDVVGERYRVRAIEARQVVLAGQQGDVILKMGGRQ